MVREVGEQVRRGLWQDGKGQETQPHAADRGGHQEAGEEVEGGPERLRHALKILGLHRKGVGCY